MNIVGEGSFAVAAAIVVGAFVSEDAATVTAAVLAATAVLDARLAFLSVFAGLWIGDIGVYAAARGAAPAVLKRRWFARSASSPARQTRIWSLGASRFVPGTRVPMYVSAGLARMPLGVFAAVTAVSASLWILLVFFLVDLAPARSNALGQELRWAGLVGLALFLLLAAWRSWGCSVRSVVARAAERLKRWEFWPAWLFYPPVALFCVWLAIRYRGLSLPTVANLNQKNGGIVGEAKIEILRDLRRAAPELTAETHLVRAEAIPERVARIEQLCRRFGIDTPFVLKPDTAQRGTGFRKITSFDQLAPYLEKVRAAAVLQRYIPGPKEAGVFYYRFPGEPHGHILGITRKEFPAAVGDGIHTLRELIELDDRSRFMARTYLRRFGHDANRVLQEGECLRLVEAGNHCQGCEFRDGADLYTEALRGAFDEISRKLPGFYVGRFDIRYESDTELREGRGFTVIELNGAASEATNIYDRRNSLWSAYRTLYRQWKLVYAIGAENRKRGFRPAAAFSVWRDWRAFASQAREFPIAD